MRALHPPYLGNSSHFAKTGVPVGGVRCYISGIDYQPLGFACK